MSVDCSRVRIVGLGQTTGQEAVRIDGWDIRYDIKRDVITANGFKERGGRIRSGARLKVNGLETEIKIVRRLRERSSQRVQLISVGRIFDLTINARCGVVSRVAWLYIGEFDAVRRRLGEDAPNRSTARGWTSIGISNFDAAAKMGVRSSDLTLELWVTLREAFRHDVIHKTIAIHQGVSSLVTPKARGGVSLVVRHRSNQKIHFVLAQRVGSSEECIRGQGAVSMRRTI